MLPSSHSFSGRWTCRSTARIKLGGERFGCFDGDRIADIDRATLDYPRDHAAAADQLILESHPDFIHAEAWLADLGDLKNGFGAQPEPGADGQPHHVESLNREVLFDGARRNADVVERFPVREQNLPKGGGTGMLVVFKPNAGDQPGVINRTHRFAMTRA